MIPKHLIDQYGKTQLFYFNKNSHFISKKKIDFLGFKIDRCLMK
jgi:hypothetical protein